MTDYMACVELQPGVQVPPGLDELSLPAERYFVIKQHMPARGFGEHLRAGLERGGAVPGGSAVQARVGESDPDTRLACGEARAG